MVFENYRKSLILQHCERSELHLHFEACGQTVLPDRSKIIRKSSNETFLVIFKHYARFIRGQNRVIFQGGNF